MRSRGVQREVRDALRKVQPPLWVRTPLLWAAVASVLGIVLGVQFRFGWWMPVLCGAMLALTWILLRWPCVAWAALLSCCCALSFAWGSLRATVPALPPEGSALVIGRVVGEPTAKPNSINLYLQGAKLLIDGKTYSVPGKLWLRYAPYGEPLGVAPKAGQTVRVQARAALPQGQRNPGGFDFRAYLLRQGAHMAAYASKPWDVSGKPSGGPLAWIRDGREALSKRMDKLFGAQAPLIRGMLIGERQDITEEEQISFRRSGIAHLLSVSGLHVGFIALPLMWLLRKLALRGMHRLLAMGAALTVYCLLVGAPASTIRACVMMTLLQGAPVAGRRYDSLSALSLAFWGMLLFNPLSLWDPSLSLSCSAVLGIALLYGKMQRGMMKPLKWLLRGLPETLPKWILEGFPRGLASLVAVSLAAQLGTLPLVALYFNEISLLALLTNLVAVPVAGVIVVAGLVATLLSFAWGPLAYPLAWMLRGLGSALQFLSDTVASVSLATLRIASPPWYVVAASFAALAFLGGMVHLGRPWRKWLLSVTLLGGTLTLSYLLAWHGPQYVQLDVGQGDAAVLRVGGYTAVIDTGSQGNGGLADYLRHEGLSVDTLFISHPHEDHAGALADLVAEGVPIREIRMPADLTGEQMDLPAYDGIMTAALAGIPIEPLHAGMSLELAPGLSVEVHGPKPQSTLDVNDLSLVLLFDIGGVRLLTTGDLTTKAEPLQEVDCDILKVAHHGSSGSTSTAFLQAATPALSLISVGYNTYGHPTQGVLDRLGEAQSRVLRTDYGGAIMLRFDGGQVGIQTYLPYPVLLPEKEHEP